MTCGGARDGRFLLISSDVAYPEPALRLRLDLLRVWCISDCVVTKNASTSTDLRACRGGK